MPELQTGLYGDLPGTLSGVSADIHSVAIVIEWADLDLRLGIRQSAGWGPSALADILSAAQTRLEWLEQLIGQLPCPAAICPPTLPFPLVAHNPGYEAGAFELELRGALTESLARLAGANHVSIASTERLQAVSPSAGRWDIRAELHSGFPYTTAHASAVAELLAVLLHRPVPKKGLITDLDDTVWSGLAGEIGPEQVSWDLANHSQLHGLYQQLLASLSEEGVLVGVASKNSPSVVEAAFARPDILLKVKHVFPMEVHWSAKSESVTRILQAWNIGADSVVFVDDSPIELAEVQAVHPSMECILFPRNDPAAAYALFTRLRDIFGKKQVSRDDTIRLQSIRGSHAVRTASQDAGRQDAFLETAEAVIRFSNGKERASSRPLELVNKTNQFNLNGVRYTPADWTGLLACPGTIFLEIYYRDKFAPLGTIGVLAGKREGDDLRVHTWVMSCRAFSRRIEHQCLHQLFSRYGIRSVTFDFQPTPKNGPLQEFLFALTGADPVPGLRLEASEFRKRCPKLFHTVEFAPVAAELGS